jgi:hypothetical protein
MASINRYPPFPHIQQQPPHQSSHLQQPQHPSTSLQAHNAFSAHHAFTSGSGGGGQNGAGGGIGGGGLSIFGPQSNAGAGGNNLPGGYATGGLGGANAFGGGVGSASQAAQMGFAHAGGPLQQALNEVGGRGTGNQRIKEVWRGNLEEEMAKVRLLIDKYPYVSMVSTSFLRVEFVSLLVIVLTLFKIGYRIPWHRSKTYRRRFWNKVFISLSDFTLQCGFAQNHTIGFNSLQC